jgi:hypothetical protein
MHLTKWIPGTILRAALLLLPAFGVSSLSAQTVLPDLTAVKADNVSGEGTVGVPWTWTVHLANGGNGAANFASGQTILTDNLPGTNIVYGLPSVSNATNFTGGINGCSITSNVLTCSAVGMTSFGVGGSLDVSFTATASMAGSYVNPTGGICAVDPANVVVESNEGNNSCNDTVTVGPDLTAVKTDNVSNATTLGNNWTWKVHLANGGNVAANFTNGQTILTDNLPSTNIGYGSASTANSTGITGSINCSIASSTLSCTAGGAVSIGAAGSMDVSFVATPTAIGTFVNPTGGICAVDPANMVVESNEGNNSCSDTVTVVGPPTISQSFAPTSFSLGTSTALTFTITNPNSGITLTGLAFTDTLLGGLMVSNPNGLSNNGCGGSVTASVGSTSISLSSGTLTASGSCNITVNVAGATTGLKSNSVTITSNEGGQGNTSVADVTVLAANVSAQVGVTQTGFVRNRATGIWSATMTVTNTGGAVIASPIQVVLTNLTPGVAMTNNSGKFDSSPYVTVLSSGSLTPGASLSVSIQFTNPSNGFISFAPVTYSGGLP